MYAAPFEYAKVSSWNEAVDLLRRYGDEARVLAGGQSLVPMMSLRLVKPQLVIDVNDADRRRIERNAGGLEIGALTRHHELETSPALAEGCPLLAEAASFIGNIRVRHRGTIGGSLAHADPAAELPCALTALRATVVVLGPDGERRIPAADFFLSYFTTALEPAEVVTVVEVPTMRQGTGTAFLELAPRTGDFATTEVAALVEADASSGLCADIRLVASGVADRPVDVTEPARSLVGSRVDERTVADAAAAVAASTDPREDERASAEYRREMVNVLSRRALLQAWRRATGGG